MSRKRRNYRPKQYLAVRHVVDTETNQVLGTVPLAAPDPLVETKAPVHPRDIEAEQRRAERDKAEADFARRILNLPPEEQLLGAAAALRVMQTIALQGTIQRGV